MQFSVTTPTTPKVNNSNVDDQLQSTTEEVGSSVMPLGAERVEKNCVDKIMEILHKNNIQITPLVVNMVRDFVWTFLTANGDGVNLRKNSNVNSEINAQVAYSFVACMCTAMVCFAVNEISKRFNIGT